MPFHGKLKDIFVDPVRRFLGPKGRTGGMPVGRQLKEVFDPRKLPRNLKRLQWLFGGGKSPYELPTQTELVQDQWRAGEIKTPRDAQAAIDLLLGLEDEDLNTARLIKTLRDDGVIADRFSRIFPGFDPNYYSSPFSDAGQAAAAVGQLGEFTDVWMIFDEDMQTQLQENPELGAAYMREVDPMGLLPVLIEQDAEAVGEKTSLWRDIGGRIAGTLKATFINPWTSADRLEELMGNAYYNKVDDPYIRNELAKRHHDVRVRGLWAGPDYEQQVMTQVDSMVSRGITGPQAAEEMEEWFGDNQLGAGGMIADLAGKVVFDPLWIVPFEAIAAKAIGTPLKAVTKAPKISTLLRLTTPAGRKVVGKEGGKLAGVRALMQMSEASYGQMKNMTPAKGLTRLLFTKTPHHLGDAVNSRLVVGLSPLTHGAATADELVDVYRGLNATLKAGKPQGILERQWAGVLDDPDIAEFAGMLADDIIPVEHLDAFLPDGALGGLGQAEKRFGLSQLLAHNARIKAIKLQEEIWGATATGRFLSKKLFPFNAAMRSVLGLVGLNNPGFVYLNFVSNLFRHMWASARHPLIGIKTAGRSLWTEGGSVLSGGGKYSDEWIRILKGTGLDPIDVELHIAAQSGAREVTDIGRNLAVDISKLTDDMGDLSVEAAGRIENDLRRAAAQPAKHIGEERRLSHKLNLFVYGTSRLDNAFRRATFVNSLTQQGHTGIVGTKIARDRLIPRGFYEGMVDAGVDPGDAERLEDALRDSMEAMVTGRRPLPAGKEAIDNEVIEIEVRRLLKGVQGNDPGVLLSGSYYSRTYKE